MSFSVVINSQYAVDTTVLNAQRNYNIDWSNFEEGDYEMSFSFESGFQEEDAFGLTYIPHTLSLPDLPLKNVISPLGRGSQSSSGVGLISFHPLGAFTMNADGTIANTFPSGQQYSSNPNNKPVICNRPSAQEFRVRFLGIEGAEITYFVQYTLMLYFKKL